MDEKIVDLLKAGKIAVIPTDTIYGIVGTALNSKIVEKIYQLRKRSPTKPMIILISSLEDLEKFEIKLTNRQTEFLKKIWPNPVSVVLRCDSEKFHYLHRGTKSLAFRMPKDEKLMEILKLTGPLVAPSANIESEKPSENIDEAKKYFGEYASFYLDGGEIKSQPSALIKLHEDGSYQTLREGIFKKLP